MSAFATTGQVIRRLLFYPLYVLGNVILFVAIFGGWGWKEGLHYWRSKP